LTICYQGLPANTPKTSRNFVAVWQSTMVPWNVTPIGRAAIPAVTQMGSVVIPDLTSQNAAYIASYGVGPEITDICATALIYVGGQSGPADSCSIGLAALTPTRSSSITSAAMEFTRFEARTGLDCGRAVKGGFNDGYLNIATPYTVIYFIGSVMTRLQRF
jgi:hypothetical protein